MDKLNYTDKAPIMKLIAHLLNRKAPLPLDQQGNVDWGTAGQVLSTDGQGNAEWVTGGSGGGDVTDVEVNGTSVVNAQGVAEVSVPTNTSDLNNDSDFIDSTDLSTALADYTPTASLASVATSGQYSDLSGTPSLATVATSGDYDDLTNKPTIPAAQVNSDWNAVSGVAQILNKPTIPTVNDATLTITQNGSSLGTFTANASANVTIEVPGGGGSGGHTIEDASGTDMSAEDNLQFADAKVTDDSGNSRTKVEVIRPITESQVSSISEDGVYLVTDGQAVPINAADVAYNGGSVAGALNALDTEVNRGSVSVTADGEKTLATLLNELYTKIDFAKLSKDTKLVISFSTSTDIYFLFSWGSNYAWFTSTYFVYTGISGYFIEIKKNSSVRREGKYNGWTDASLSQWASGTTIAIYY